MPRDRTQTVDIWETAQSAFFALDAGGVLADEAADVHFERIWRAGLRHVTVNGTAAWAASRAWYTARARAAGFRITLAASPFVDGGLAHGTEVPAWLPTYHTQYPAPVPAAQRYYWRCMSYRGAHYTAALAAFNVVLAAVLPDAVILDDEVWNSPAGIEVWLFDNFAESLTNCTDCVSVANAEVNLAAAGQDLIDLVHANVGNVPITLFECPNRHFPVSITETPAPVFYWPHGVVGSGQNYLQTLDGWITGGVARSTATFPWVGFPGGRPWITVYKYSDGPRRNPAYPVLPAVNDGETFLSPGEMRAVAKRLAKNGATGISLWPGPTGYSRAMTGSTNGWTEYWDLRYWELVAEANKVFHASPRGRRI